MPFHPQIKVCNGFVIVAGGLRGSLDATVQIYRQIIRWNREITYELRNSIRGNIKKACSYNTDFSVVNC